MILWIIAVVLLASLAIIGYYQGAIRVGFSLIGLLVGAALALPLGGLVKPILPVVGVHHPVLISLIAPAVVYLLILIGFKIGGFTVHRKVDTYYKYQSSDTKRLLFERLMQRLGICLGIANAAVYFFLICVVSYVLGYFAVQFATSPRDTFILKTVSLLGRNLEQTGMTKAIAPFQPAPVTYYTGIDILADIFHTPLLQQRLSTYPPFLLLAERGEFQSVAKDTKFQELWLRSPSFDEFTAQEPVKRIVQNLDLYQELVNLVGADLEDLQTYLHTGESPKFADERILGRWTFDQRNSINRARRVKPNMGSAELRALRIFMATTLADTELTATVDNKIILKSPAGRKEGSWKPGPTVGYVLTIPEGEVNATIDSGRLTFMLDKVPVVFRKK